MDEREALLASLVVLFVLGVTTQWIAWWIHVPAILLLLLTGSIAGSYLEFIKPDEVFGELLLPIISLSVGIILFEGGLNLKFAELRHTWRSLVGLLTVGVLVTWGLAACAAMLILGMSPPVAILLGSVLVVTGPTVIGPLLRDIRPSGHVGVIAKWEGIVIDPIGAILAVLVFNTITPLGNGQLHSVLWIGLSGLVSTLLTGVVIGILPAVFLAWLMRRFLLPDYLQNPMTLMLVLGSFAVANSLKPEAGLLAATVMGIAMANIPGINISKILEFKESIATLLISTLFILLSARVPLDRLWGLGWQGPAFAMLLILLVRPVSVWLSTIGSGLSRAERGFLASFAPRGIVAAAVASVFALRLENRGEEMVPVTFWVIFTTVAVYGLGAPLVARRLGLAVADAQGLLIAGANKTVREIAAAIKPLGFQVTMIDTQFSRIRRANRAELDAIFANVLSEEVLDLVDFSGAGKFLAMTGNAQVNTLAAIRFREYFGRSNVYQLKSDEVRPSYLETRWQNHMAGRPLFAEDLTYEKLDSLIAGGAKLSIVSAEFLLGHTASSQGGDASTGNALELKVELPAAAGSGEEEASLPGPSPGDAPRQLPASDAADGEPIWPLFLVDNRRLIVCSPDTKTTLRAGQIVVVLSMRQIIEKPDLVGKESATPPATPDPNRLAPGTGIAPTAVLSAPQRGGAND